MRCMPQLQLLSVLLAVAQRGGGEGGDICSRAQGEGAPK